MMRPNARSPSITSQESYSAVMITDLVADVPVNTEFETETEKTTKEQNNLAYDGQLDEESNQANGGGISRGVILNAVQFGQPESKTKNDEKPIQLTASLPVPTLTPQISEHKGFKDMSLQRKVAFGFSFLPSILFVLCFAVILPCNVPKSCVDETWIKTFNNTDATSRLEISENIIFTALKERENVLLGLKKNNGETNEIQLPARPAYLKCGKIMDKDKTDCIVLDKSGNIYRFNNSHSNVLLSSISDAEMIVSSPVFLSGCTDKMEDIAVAVSPTVVKVIHGGNKISNFTISDCDSVPVQLASWTINGSSSIVFACDKDGQDKLIRVPQSIWCDPSNNSTKMPYVLKKGTLDSIKTSIFKPLEDSLVLWSGEEATMILPYGTPIWTVSNLSQPEENRFILHGNFQGENKQLAFFSSNLTTLKVTLLDPSKGSILKTIVYEDTEVTEVMLLQGKKRDFALLLTKKAEKATDTVTSAFAQISDISTTIVSLLSNEELKDGTSKPRSEELALLDLDANPDTLKKIKDLKDSANKSTMTVISDKETGILSVYHLSTSDNLSVRSTEVRKITVANWDKSTKSKCLA